MKFTEYLNENKLNEASVKVGTFIGWSDIDTGRGERAGGVVVAKIDGGYIIHQRPGFETNMFKRCVDDAKRSMGTANDDLVFMDDSLKIQSEFCRGRPAIIFKNYAELLSWQDE